MLKGKELFWWRQLIVVTVIMILTGLAMVVLPGPTQKLFSLMLLSSTEGIANFGQGAANHISFVTAVLGAVMFGWNIAILLILLGPFRRGSREAWLIISLSLTAWFIPDTTFSFLSGFWQNGVGNIVIAILYAIPLAATRKNFVETDS